MKKVLFILTLLSSVMVGCSHSNSELVGKDLPCEDCEEALPDRPTTGGAISVRPPLAPAEFDDPVLAKAVRDELRLRPEANIPMQLVVEMSALEPAKVDGVSVKKLTGIEFCKNLQYLDLTDHEVNDISLLWTAHEAGAFAADSLINLKGNPIFKSYDIVIPLALTPAHITKVGGAGSAYPTTLMPPKTSDNREIISKLCEAGVNVLTDEKPSGCL